MNIDPSVPANRFDPYIRGMVLICGMVYWFCRHCGTLNRDRVRYLTSRVRCGNRLCKRWMIIKAIQEDVPR